MTRFLIIVMYLLCLPALGQQLPIGTFDRIGTDGNQNGQLLIFPESDSSMLVYLEVTRGAPGYNSGTIYSRINSRGKQVTLKSVEDFFECEIVLAIESDAITISTINDDCGFGYGVISDGTYYKIDSKTPRSFLTMDGIEVYFSQTSPEEYYN